MHILKEREEAKRLKEVGPAVLLHEDVVADFEASSELLDDDFSGGAGHVERRVLLRVRRCDDGHEMVAVGRIHLKNINKHGTYLFESTQYRKSHGS